MKKNKTKILKSNSKTKKETRECDLISNFVSQKLFSKNKFFLVLFLCSLISSCKTQTNDNSFQSDQDSTSDYQTSRGFSEANLEDKPLLHNENNKLFSFSSALSDFEDMFGDTEKMKKIKELNKRRDIISKRVNREKSLYEATRLSTKKTTLLSSLLNTLKNRLDKNQVVRYFYLF